MYNDNPEIDALMSEFQAVTQQLDMVLKDIEWRQPDVKREEAELRALKRAALKDPGVDVASQAIVVRVGQSILNDKIAEAKDLEKRMLSLKDQLEKAEAAKEKPEEGEETGEAVPKETQPVG